MGRCVCECPGCRGCTAGRGCITPITHVAVPLLSHMSHVAASLLSHMWLYHSYHTCVCITPITHVAACEVQVGALIGTPLTQNCTTPMLLPKPPSCYCLCHPHAIAYATLIVVPFRATAYATLIVVPTRATAYATLIVLPTRAAAYATIMLLHMPHTCYCICHTHATA